MPKRVIGVSQLNEYLKSVIDSEEILKSIGIRGEVAGISVRNNSAFFSLSDAECRIDCIMFNYKPGALTEGGSIVATGSPSFYPKSGRLSFVVSEVAEDGKGDLYKQFVLLKEKLHAEGLFDRKIPVPKRNARIGVVTSRYGSVIHDIINVATRRDPSVDILLYPVKVQGLGAEEDIAEGLKLLDGSGKADVIIIGRGGGSFADLAPFNSEIVARAVAACKTPIVSAVGHETDTTLCDYAADLRAPTPSAAAELVTEDIRLREGAIKDLLRQLRSSIERMGARTFGEISGMTARLRSGARNAEYIYTQRTLADAARIRRQAVAALASEDTDLYGSVRRLSVMSFPRLSEEAAGFSARLASTKPARAAEGYVKLYKDGAAVVSACGIMRGDRVRAELTDGAIEMNVTDVDLIEVNK